MKKKMLEMIEALTESRGLVTVAMESSGATYKEHREWLKDDDYKARVDEIEEEKKDYLEKLVITACEKMNGTVISNMMKTKLAGRGYSADTGTMLDFDELLIGFDDEKNQD